MLLGDLDAAVPQEQRDLVDGHSGQQQFDGEGVAEHVRVTALQCAVRILQRRNLEK